MLDEALQALDLLNSLSGEHLLLRMMGSRLSTAINKRRFPTGQESRSRTQGTRRPAVFPRNTTFSGPACSEGVLEDIGTKHGSGVVEILTVGGEWELDGGLVEVMFLVQDGRDCFCVSNTDTIFLTLPNMVTMEVRNRKFNQNKVLSVKATRNV